MKRVRRVITPLIFTGIGALSTYMVMNKQTPTRVSMIDTKHDDMPIVKYQPKVKYKTKWKTKTKVKKVALPWSIQLKDGVYPWLNICSMHGGVTIIRGDERKYVRVGCRDGVWFNWSKK